MIDRNGILGLAGARVLVVGDMMLDLYIDGVAERLSPEAPVPVIRRTGNRQALGGAGNVVANLKALGAEVTVAAACGPTFADDIARLLGEIDGVIVVENDRDISKMRIMAGSHQVVRVDSETPRPLGREAEAELVNWIAGNRDLFDVICIADYGKGVVTRKVWQAALGTNRPVLVDTKALGAGWAGARLVKPNLAELSAAFGRPIAGDEMVSAAAKEMVARAEVGAVLVTRGADGMTLVRNTGTVHHIRSQPTAVADVTGAGDTVLAVLGMAAARGIDIGEAAQLANVAAGLVVAKPGTATVTLEEVAAAAAPLIRSPKIATLKHAAEQAAAWKQAGLTVGFTNGCFDLLHDGHLSLLADAAVACDRLIVGLASDAHVRELKGEGRPKQAFPDRAAELVRLSTVSMVVGCDLPCTMLDLIQPDILFRGYDQSIAPEDAAIMERTGGRIVRISELPGHSTTAQIEGRAA